MSFTLCINPQPEDDAAFQSGRYRVSTGAPASSDDDDDVEDRQAEQRDGLVILWNATAAAGSICWF